MTEYLSKHTNPNERNLPHCISHQNLEKEANDFIGSSHAEQICDWLDSDKEHYSTKIASNSCLNCV